MATGTETVKIDIREFARRVEGVCDFFLNRMHEQGLRNGSKDILVLEKLKDEAADIQFHRIEPIVESLDGLDDYMRSLNAPFKEQPKES